MSVPQHVHEEIRRLLWAVRDGELLSDDAAKLCSLLTDPEVRELYVWYSYLCGSLQWDHSAGNDECRMMIDELTAQQPDIHRPSFIIHHSPPIHYPLSTIDSFVGGMLFSYLVAAVIVSVGLLIGAFTYVSQPERQVGWDKRSDVPPAGSYAKHAEPVGQITGMVDCQWDGSGVKNSQSPIPNLQSLVSLGDKFALSSGLMEITYDTGARVILQGPVTYEVESKDGGYLSLGKLTAKLDKRSTSFNREPTASASSAEISKSPNLQISKLFVVKTPTATVTDLGTEFGVEVDEKGHTTSRVFRGSVKLEVAASDGGAQPEATVVHENESVRVDKDLGPQGPRLTVHRLVADRRTFVRQLIQPPKVIDLLDIVAGGNGTGHHRERGIDAATGMEDPVFLPGNHGGDRTYRRVLYWRNLIDGLFVPDGSAGPVQLDSAGHTFGGFPRTTGTVWGSIWARAAQVNARDERTKLGSYWVYIIGHSSQFMPHKRGLLGMCPNAGITFNLQAMRKAYPGVRPARLRAVAGMANTEDMANTEGLADIWIFVDGQLKLKRTQLRERDGVVPVDIELDSADRFLTIVSTDGGNGITSDWIVFGDPVLEMALTEENGK